MSQVYLSIPTDEERLNGEKHTPSIRHDARLWRSVGQTALKHWAWVGHLVLLSISMTLFTLSFCKDHEKLSDLAYTEKFSSYSPVAPVVKYSSQRYNLTPIVEGPYVGFGDAVDKEWSRIADGVGDIMITEAELDRLGLPRNSLKVKNEKTGEVGYRAAVEVIHQLHCLNYLRQFVHADYYNQRESDLSGHDGIEDQMGHADHCIETLRMNLMCQSDIGIFTFRLYPEYGYANDDYWPDFSTLHTCRNFEDIWQWNLEHTVSWTHDS